MADAHTGRLCVEIIHSQFGPLTTKIAQVLLTRGRLPLAQIIRFSALKPRTVRAAILVLVQHNILWHAQTEEDGEVFEVNTDECLMRLRFGKFVWQAEKLFGSAASEIIQIILDHGKLRPPEIISLLAIYDSKGIAVYSQAMHKLVSASYLKPSTILSHHSPRDKQIKYEAEEKAKISGFPTAKELREAKETASARLKREEEDAEKVGLKRKAKEQPGARPNKRKAAVEEDVVDDEVYFRVNYEKFNIHIRNALIVKTARERFNDGAALVVEAAMKITESTQVDLSEVCSDPISVANIVMQLSDEEALASGLVQSSKKVSNATCIKDYLGILSSADNPTLAGKAMSFVLKHSADGIRILRLLLHTGNMDEKQVRLNFAYRNPTWTFYLWYISLYKAYSVILVNVYKTLEVKAVLEKRERSDVSQDESLLTRLERDILKEWEGKQEKLTVLEMRVEETVFILKDLGVLGIKDD
ncbi:RNA polymerase III subunit RPC82-domain-containing protein [Crucibulum laeve]|uniref:DNA-directed RNA polymerase III subunit RPC3 n=1 Tax=Crucibulum laeve TaxID=68775 RepID=A0A5C3MBG1_9AGAR|nr:RNA polymerase III subunit RPC82-domain-containing protein [Crucibulum laeve]